MKAESAFLVSMERGFKLLFGKPKDVTVVKVVIEGELRFRLSVGYQACFGCA